MSMWLQAIVYGLIIGIALSILGMVIIAIISGRTKTRINNVVQYIKQWRK